jgi:hypothetical protein
MSRGQRRRNGALVSALVVALCGLLGTALPAQAASVVGGDAGSGRSTVESLLTARTLAAPPGVTAQAAAPPSRLKPTGPRALLSRMKGAAITLGRPEAGKAPRMVAGAETASPTCVPYLSKLTEPTGPNTVRVDYLAELVCNFYLSAYGRGYLFDRTNGATNNGHVISLGEAFFIANDYYRTSTFGHVGATNVFLNEDMLKGMWRLNLQDGYGFQVTAIAGGLHSTPTSRHYFGKAFDVDFINGVKVTASNPYFRAFMSRCYAYGAIEVLGPGDPGHDRHLHCAWP